MPTFVVEKDEEDIAVDFEVFCSCGAGLCNQSEVRISRRRQSRQVVVEPCEKCLDRAAEEMGEKVRTELQDVIDELKDRIAALEEVGS